MTKFKPKEYDEDDLRTVLEEIERLDAEQRTIRAESAGRCSAIAKKIEDAKKTATKLKIPKKLLSTLIKQRKLEQQLQDLADDVPEELAEIYEEESGQFSLFVPEKGEKAKPAAKTAATRAAGRARAHSASEQREGGRILDELTH
jgi:predicted transcriptional regulator